jgi:pyruvate dehydrogenase E1 component
MGHGMREMLVEQKDVFYYLTLMNENYAQPNLPPEVHTHVIAGCYQFNTYQPNTNADQSVEIPKFVTLMGSGAILTEVIKAAQALAARGIGAHVISVTSWSELTREAHAAMALPAGAGQAGTNQPTTPFITAQLARTDGPIVAATDYVRAVPESIRAYLPPGRTYQTLGTDGFGRSDTRSALRRHFSVDAASIEQAAWRSLEDKA